MKNEKKSQNRSSQGFCKSWLRKHEPTDNYEWPGWNNFLLVKLSFSWFDYKLLPESGQFLNASYLVT